MWVDLEIIVISAMSGTCPSYSSYKKQTCPIVLCKWYAGRNICWNSLRGGIGSNGPGGASCSLSSGKTPRFQRPSALANNFTSQRSQSTQFLLVKLSASDGIVENLLQVLFLNQDLNYFNVWLPRIYHLVPILPWIDWMGSESRTTTITTTTQTRWSLIIIQFKNTKTNG